MEGVDNPEGTHKTPNSEFKVSEKFWPIKLEFPGFWKAYTSQMPFNDVSNTRFIISDNRLQLGDEDQA